MTRVYETTYIALPDLAQDQYDEVISKYRKMIEDLGGKLAHQEIWGRRKLAYPIKKREHGFYVFSEVHVDEKTDPELIDKLEREYSYDDRIIRYLTVKLEKFAIEWAEKRKKRVKDGKVEMAEV